MNELDIRNLRLADFNNNFNKTRQSASDVILQEGGRIYRYSDASQKNHVWACWGKAVDAWARAYSLTKAIAPSTRIFRAIRPENQQNPKAQISILCRVFYRDISTVTDPVPLQRAPWPTGVAARARNRRRTGKEGGGAARARGRNKSECPQRRPSFAASITGGARRFVCRVNDQSRLSVIYYPSSDFRISSYIHYAFRRGTSRHIRGTFSHCHLLRKRLFRLG